MRHVRDVRWTAVATVVCLIALLLTVSVARGESWSNWSGGTKLNSFVYQFLNVTSNFQSSYTFNMRAGRWVFIRSTASVPSSANELWIGIDSATKQNAMTIHTYGQNGPVEAMKFIPAGNHTVYVSANYANYLSNMQLLVLRTVPALINDRYPAEGMYFVEDEFGPYDWDFLGDCGYLQSVNDMATADGRLGDSLDHIDAWKASGRRWVTYTSRPDTATESTASGIYYYYDALDGYGGDFQGVLVDEFGNESTSLLQRYADAIDSLNYYHSGTSFSAYVHSGFYNVYQTQQAANFVQKIVDGNGYLIFESYLSSRANTTDFTSACEYGLTYLNALKSMRSNMMIYNLGWCLSESSVPWPQYDNRPQTDFCQQMDRQFQWMAATSNFEGLGAVAMYRTGYANEELHRWVAQMYRQYCIEGVTTALNSDSYLSTAIDNGDFMDYSAMQGFHRYTETDPNSHVTVNWRQTVVSGLPRTGDTYVYKDQGTGFFGGVFRHDFDVHVASIEQGAIGAVWGVSNSVGSMSAWANDGQALSLHFYGTGGNNATLYLYNYDGGSSASTSLSGVCNVDYYCTVERTSETTAEARIYSDSARTSLIATLSLNTIPNGRRYRYNFVANSQPSGASVISYSVSNLDLEASWGDQTISGYTEADSSNLISVGRTRVKVAGMPRDGATRFYQDKGASFFADTFRHDFDLHVTSIEQGAIGVVWGVSNSVGNTDTWGSNGQTLSLQFYGTGSNNATLYLYNYDGGSYSSANLTGVVNVDYYCTVERTGETTAEARIYSNPARTTQVASLSLNTIPSGRRYRYLFLANTGTGGYNTPFSFDHRNVNLHELTLATPKRWIVLPAVAGSIRGDEWYSSASSPTFFNSYAGWQGRCQDYQNVDFGNSFIRMTRSSTRPNKIVQKVTGLTPGKTYAFRMITCDYGDLVNSVRSDEQLVVSVGISNATLLTGSKYSFQTSCLTYPSYPEFFFNYHWQVFEATSSTAVLTISDWQSDQTQGGTTGQTIAYSYISVRPFLSPD